MDWDFLLTHRFPCPTEDTPHLAHLRILATTDLHSHIVPFDYCADRPVDTAGFARTATLIRQMRADCPNCLLLDNGDFLQGGPMGDYISTSPDVLRRRPHPIIAAMNMLRYDAGTLGNHEFNYGLGFLERALSHASHPVVCANAVRQRGPDPTQDQTHVPPYTILIRDLVDGAGRSHSLRIGIIGLLPPQFTAWDRSVLQDKLTSRDIVATAAAYVPKMRQEGAQIIIALCHSGIGAAEETGGMENAAVPLAAIDGIDVVITGHTHMVFPSAQFDGMTGVDAAAGTISGKPAVMSGFWGSHLGLIDLLLDRKDTEWRIVGSRSEALPIATRAADGTTEPLVDSDADVLATVAEDHTQTLKYMRRKVGTTRTPLHSYFALVANSTSLQLVCRAQEWHLRRTLKGTPHAHLPLLSAAAPFKVGGRGGPDHFTEVPTGSMALRNVADLYAYPNTICAVRITGAQVADWLERSARIFNQIVPGDTDQLLINPDFASYNFDVIMGVTYEIDPTSPPRFSLSGALLNPLARRIVNLCFNGARIDPLAEFIVATNTYRLSTSPELSDSLQSRVVYAAPILNRDILRDYITAHPDLDLTTEPNWAFSALPGTSVLFDTSPMAAQHLSDLTGMSIESADGAPDGFTRFRLHV